MNQALANAFWDRLLEASRDINLPFKASDIARELDIWPSAVARWQSGLGLPYEKHIIALAQNRGVTVEWLKTGRGLKHAENAMDTGTRELLKIWLALPGDAQERLLHAARYEHTLTPPPSKNPGPGAANGAPAHSRYPTHKRP